MHRCIHKLIKRHVSLKQDVVERVVNKGNVPLAETIRKERKWFRTADGCTICDRRRVP